MIEYEKESIEMRKVYCETLIELASENEDIVILDSDLMSSMGMIPFFNKFPERTFNCGIQEANMMGVACGLSVTGKIPYAHTFGPFATRRCYDQIFMSGSYAKSNVKIIGSDPGVTAQFNGGTHMPFEDMGIMRNIPEMTIIEPTDSTMLKSIIKQISNIHGMFYIRLLRKNAIKIYNENTKFKIGKSITLREGNDVTIIANGIMVSEALKAADTLESEDISARVIDMFTLKPIDKNAVINSAVETGAIVTCENHNIINGLGSAVCEILCEHSPTPVERIGVKDLFGEVGPLNYLQEKFNLTCDDIVNSAKKAIKRKLEVKI